MNILIPERINQSNQYIELLANAYASHGHHVIFDVQNFLFSDFQPDFIHLHWPEALYKWRHQLDQNQNSIDLIQSRFSYFKSNKIPIAYTAHNILPHKDVTDFDREIYRMVIASADIIVHHGHESIPLINEQFDEAKEKHHIVCPHGPYPYRKVDPAAAKSQYALPQDLRILLNFGRQRKSKGPDFIQSVFASLADKSTYLFTIGPNPPSSKSEKAMRILQGKVHNTFPTTFRKKNLFRDVSHNEIPTIFAASDLVILGHQSGLNSGLIAQAISCKKPLIYPNLGNFREQAADWPWAEEYTPGNVESAVSALERLLTRMDEKDQLADPDNSLWLEKNSWDRYVSTLLKKVESL